MAARWKSRSCRGRWAISNPDPISPPSDWTVLHFCWKMAPCEKYHLKKGFRGLKARLKTVVQYWWYWRCFSGYIKFTCKRIFVNRTCTPSWERLLCWSDGEPCNLYSKRHHSDLISSPGLGVTQIQVNQSLHGPLLDPLFEIVGNRERDLQHPGRIREGWGGHFCDVNISGHCFLKEYCHLFKNITVPHKEKYCMIPFLFST